MRPVSAPFRSAVLGFPVLEGASMLARPAFGRMNPVHRLAPIEIPIGIDLPPIDGHGKSRYHPSLGLPTRDSDRLRSGFPAP